jgi:hypothetical protein
MSAIQGISNNARMYYEANIRKTAPGYAATINGLSNPIRVRSAGTVAQVNNVSYRHVIDTFA